MNISRRHFLAGGAAITFALAAHPLDELAAEPGKAERKGKSKKVVVIGAGLAGLVAAYELTQMGHEVTIVEAQDRAGGRIYTLRDCFPDGLYTEAGGVGFNDSPGLRKYLSVFKLQTARFFECPFYVSGHWIDAKRPPDVWPLSLTPEEQKLGLAGLVQKYVHPAVKELGDPNSKDFPRPSAPHYDQVSFAEFLRQQGASPAAIELIRWGLQGIDEDGDEGIASISALFALTVVAAPQNSSCVIKGGNDLLPKAFATSLASKIRYKTPAVRIEQDAHRARVIVHGYNGFETLECDRVVIAIPGSTLRQVEISPALSHAQTAAIAALSYTSVSLVFLQSRRAFWPPERRTDWSPTDLPVMFISTTEGPSPRGILKSFTTGARARKIERMDEEGRIKQTLDGMQQLFPAVHQNFEWGTGKCWGDDPWARGGYIWSKPGLVASVYPHLGQPEGFIHLAGDLTPPFGGMSEALESGIRAAREVSES